MLKYAHALWKAARDMHAMTSHWLQQSMKCAVWASPAEAPAINNNVNAAAVFIVYVPAITNIFVIIPLYLKLQWQQQYSPISGAAAQVCLSRNPTK